MAKPAKSALEKRKELIDAQDHLSEKEKKKLKEEAEKAAEKSAAFEEKELQELDVDELLGKKSEPKKETASVPFYIKNEEKELDELDFSEFFEKDDLPLRIMANEPVFFRDEDREEENEYPGFGKHFLEILAEDEAKKNKENDLIGAKDYEMLLEQKRKNKEKDLPGYRPGEREESKYLFSPTVRGSITRTNNMYNVYKSGEEWLMSDEGGDDLVKGFINNVRSSIGSGAEDFAYWLNDVAPWYTPAAKVIENNMAGEIEEQAQRNFGNARASGVNGNVVDFLDSASKGLGYNVFGFKAGNYIQDGADAFNEYRNLRDSGYTKEEATLAMAKKAPMYILSNKADDYIGKNSGIDEVLFGKSGIVSKTDDVMEYENFKKIIGDDFTYDLDSFEKMKYNEPEKWQMINLDYSRRTNLIAHPEKALPGASIAIAKEDKFVKYLFNQENADGYAKGKSITEHLGYSKSNWQNMRNEILTKANKYPAEYKETIAQGDKYEQRMILYGPKNNPANVLVGWLVEPDGNVHLTTAFITNKGDYKK